MRPASNLTKLHHRNLPKPRKFNNKNRMHVTTIGIANKSITMMIMNDVNCINILSEAIKANLSLYWVQRQSKEEVDGIAAKLRNSKHQSIGISKNHASVWHVFRKANNVIDWIISFVIKYSDD